MRSNRRSGVVEVEELIGRVLRKSDLSTVRQQVVAVDVDERDAVTIVRHVLNDQSTSHCLVGSTTESRPDRRRRIE